MTICIESDEIYPKGTTSNKFTKIDGCKPDI